MICDLLVHVSGDNSGRRRAVLAIELAVSMGARLAGMHIKPPPEIAPGYWPRGIDVAMATREATLTREASIAKANFLEATAHSSANSTWSEGAGEIARGISDRARFADLVILGQNEAQEPAERHPLPMAHSVVLMCGRPVLVVPVETQTLVPAKVAVAWDGGREAVRAVHDALPILKLAQSIDIVTMAKRSEDAGVGNVDDLIAHLAHHGISAIHRLERFELSDEHTSLLNIVANGYDLIVMGGYSHPKWVEFIFGGPTISALLSSKIPVLVSH